VSAVFRNSTGRSDGHCLLKRLDSRVKALYPVSLYNDLHGMHDAAYPAYTVAAFVEDTGGLQLQYQPRPDSALTCPELCVIVNPAREKKDYGVVPGYL
jgi:hypothetical protein